MPGEQIQKLPVVVASDHAGLESKKVILESIAAEGFQVEDLGPETAESVDYPDFAAAVGKRIEAGTASFGVLVCGTGTGMAIAANKLPGVRAALLYDDTSARFARLHNNANVAVFGSRTMTVDQMLTRLRIFLNEPFEGGRHARRVDKITQLENKAPRR
ncbi:MAG TPA: ribose 5-phosphate isomerase B [Candidatus Deferrimicrobiaceae bacterium]